MTNVASLAGTAALIGDPARASMLVTLMDGRALTAGELAQAAGVTSSTASGHLGRMLDAGLLAVEKQGRHRYYRLASTSVAALIESLMSIAGEFEDMARGCRPIRTGPRDRALRRARLCYDHLAGEVAVGIADCMIARGHLELCSDGGSFTPEGSSFLAALGIELKSRSSHPRRMHCRPCLDWSERRPHIAGLVGQELYSALAMNDWIRAPEAGRAVLITPRGIGALQHHFGLYLH